MRIVTVSKSVQFRGVLAGFAALLMLAATVFGANIATADPVWIQSYARASQTEVCVAQPGETEWQESWGTDSSWKPSWEQWANGGNGGWTCTRSIAWSKTSELASSDTGGSSMTYRVGETGPGGGLVFLISGGKTYEMAPKTWNGGGEDPSKEFCMDTVFAFTGAFGTAVGTGTTNTAEMVIASVACNPEAADAVRAYPGTDSSAGQWFLPSKDELNAMYNYSQISGFNAVTYGFESGFYWSSSRLSSSSTSYSSWWQRFTSGTTGSEDQDVPYYVRPIRSF